MTRVLATMALGLAVFGCWPPAFFEYEDGAPVQVLEKPGSYGVGSFGATLASFDGEELLFVGSDAEAPIYSFQLSEGERRLPSEFETARLCDDERCEGVGSVLASLDGWREDERCIAVGGAADKMVVTCEEHEIDAVIEGVSKSGFATALSGVPNDDAVLVGTRSAGAFVVRRRQLDPMGIDVDGCSVDGLGRSVAAASAFWALGGTDGIVVADPESLALLGRLEAPEGASTLLAAQIIGTDTVDLLAAGSDDVRIWDGDQFGEDPDCEDLLAPDRVLSCEDAPKSDVVCSGAFGASMAAADFNADELIDLAVGDPQATVAGRSEAGAVFVYSGSEGLGPSPDSVLRASSPSQGALVGRAIVAARMLDRPEAVVGSMGEVLFFFCTGLDGDRPEGSDLSPCLP